MSARKIRRAAEHASRKLARKAGFPITPVTPEVPLPPTDPPNEKTATTQAPDQAKPPISPAKLAANRANSQHSTGATTDAGRATSSQNRTIHGLARHNGIFVILPSEDSADFEALKTDLASEHQPTTITESILLNTMAESHWLVNRAQLLADCCCSMESGFIEDPIHFSLYVRYQSTHRRAFHKALNDLLKLRAERRKAAVGFEAQQRQPASQDPAFRADFDRLGMASRTRGPEYDRLKAEFIAKHFPNHVPTEAPTAQAAA